MKVKKIHYDLILIGDKVGGGCHELDMDEGQNLILSLCFANPPKLILLRNGALVNTSTIKELLPIEETKRVWDEGALNSVEKVIVIEITGKEEETYKKYQQLTGQGYLELK